MEVYDELDQLLEAALSNAVGPARGIRKVVVSSIDDPPISASKNPSADTSDSQAPEVIITGEEFEKHRQEYENLVKGWRAESAIKRQQAEEERARWEAIRAAENEESLRTGENTIRDSWEQLDDSPIAGPLHHRFFDGSVSPSPVDGRDLVTNEPRGGNGRAVLQSVLPPPKGVASPHKPLSSTTPSNLDDSRHSDSHNWEEIPSMESSYPSLSFPSNADTPSPQSPVEKYQENKQIPRTEAAPINATLSIFDSSLSKRTRVLALISSLTINFVLPFVNGVMLGFGEIFAKSLLGSFGWSVAAGTTAGAVGIGTSSPFKRKER